MDRNVIKDFYGRIIGFQDTQPNGDIIAKNEYGKILGRYDAKMKMTKTENGKIVSRGDTTSALIWQAYRTHQQELQQQQELNKNK